MAPPDTLFGDIPTWTGVYATSAVAFGLSALLMYHRVFKLVLLGKRAGRLDRPLRRFIGAIPLAFGQTKVLQSVSFRDRAGLAHVFILWGFLSFVFSYLVFVYGDATWRPFSKTILTETGVEIFSLYLDLLAGGFLIVLAWAGVRRWAATPHRLSFDLTKRSEAAVILLLIGLLMVLSISAEAFYVAAGGDGPTTSAIIGSALGEMLSDAGLDRAVADGLHAITWWSHLAVVLGFAVYIPVSKHMHLLASPLSFFLRSLEPAGTLSTPRDLETAERFGASQVEDFTTKELLDGFACAVCGRCTDACPAHISEKTLSPMHVVLGLREYLAEAGPMAVRGDDGATTDPLVGGTISNEALWDCLTCGACVQACPVGVEHIDPIVDMRRYLAMEKAEVPETGMSALMSMEQRGHPWRGTPYSRLDWAEGLDVKTLAEHPTADVLFWVGCTGALEKRSQNVARSMAAVLKRAGVDFAVLGDEETCTGDPARRMGNEYLYQTMATQNIETLKRYAVKKVVTICPHCFNTMKNEYPHLGGDFEVYHYSEFVAELIEDGRLKTITTVDANVAYHDSCYLGRHNGVYDAPRRIADAVPGITLVEMERSRERGFCCGAGGGHMWLEESRGKRVNHVRTEQFLETGADTVAVSCPFCLQMFEEGIDSTADGSGARARDLIEILDESLGPAV